MEARGHEIYLSRKKFHIDCITNIGSVRNISLNVQPWQQRFCRLCRFSDWMSSFERYKNYLDSNFLNITGITNESCMNFKLSSLNNIEQVWNKESSAYTNTKTRVSKIRKSREDTTVKSYDKTLVASLFFPVRIPAWTAAPYATASSGFKDLQSSFPLKKSCSICWILGILKKGKRRARLVKQSLWTTDHEITLITMLSGVKAFITAVCRHMVLWLCVVSDEN